MHISQVQSDSAFEQSEGLRVRAEALIPGLTHSMMKRPEHFAPGHFPIYLERGTGCRVTCVDGHEYIDYICGLGATSLGHNHPALVSALQRALGRGVLHSLPTRLEVEVAEHLSRMIPGAEMVRCFKTGADATSAAVRLARHITRRERIATVGYNGWHDHFMVDTPGIPQAVRDLTERFLLMADGSEERLLQRLTLELEKPDAERIACVLFSLPYNRELTPRFLARLSASCKRAGTLLILDEIVTGFRLARGGAQEYFEAEADLACFSKALAAGMPLSAVTGKREYMARMAELQVSTTFGGELLSLAACQAALTLYEETEVIEAQAALGRRLKEKLTRLAQKLALPLSILGYDPIPLFRFGENIDQHQALMRQFQGLMAERGVLLRRDVNFLCASHAEADIDETVRQAESALTAMR